MGKEERELEEKSNWVIEAKRLLVLTQWSTGKVHARMAHETEAGPFFPGSYQFRNIAKKK